MNGNKLQATYPKDIMKRRRNVVEDRDIVPFCMWYYTNENKSFSFVCRLVGKHLLGVYT